MKFKKILSTLITTTILSQLVQINVFAAERNTKYENIYEVRNTGNLMDEVKFIGVDNTDILVGDQFKFKEGVQIIDNGIDVSNNMIITNINGEDISNIESVRIPDTNSYTYVYKYLDSKGNIHQKERVITGVNTETTINLELKEKDKLLLNYKITNEYNYPINIYLEDWSLYEKNHKEELGVIASNESLSVNREFIIIPTFKDTSDIPDGALDGLDTDNSKKNIIYLPDGQAEIGFAPNFTIKGLDGSTISSYGKIDKISCSSLVSSAKNISDRLIIKSTFPNKKFKVGDKLLIKYNVKNNNEQKLEVKVSSWTYYGKYIEETLGEVSPNAEKEFFKEVIITEDMIDENNVLKKDIQSYHVYNDTNTELFVKKYNMEYSNDKPIIEGVEDITITQGDIFKELDGVTANDTEDGTITDRIIVSGVVETNIPGKYELIYSVTDNDRNRTEVKRIVTVNPKLEGLNHIPTIDVTDKVLTVGDIFNPLEGVKAYDKEDGEIILTEANIVSNNVDVSQAGVYQVTYKVTDKDGASATKTITVTVNPKLEDVKPDEDKPTNENKPELDKNPNYNIQSPNRLPNTGAESSLPILGALSLILGTALSFKKKKN